MSAWTTAERTNAAGERTFVFQRHCYSCPFVQEEAGAIVERTEMNYARTQFPGEEADD